MALPGLSPRLLGLSLFLFLAAAAAVAAADEEVKACPGLEACRSGVANAACCRAIQNGITEPGGCSCVCRQLSGFHRSSLIRDCGRSGCSKCAFCPCSGAEEEISAV